MENENRISLSGEFPEVSTKTWEEKIHEDLKGADYEKKLVWETHEGFRIRPYYRAEDLGGTVQPAPPQKTSANDWLIRQDIKVKDVMAANAYALSLLAKGINSIGFDLRGSDLLSEETIHGLLGSLPVEKVPVNFEITSLFPEVLRWISSFAEKNKLDTAKIQGSISLNPLGRLASTGKYRTEMLEDFNELGNCIEYAAENLPAFRVLTNCGNVFHHAGAASSQELAFSMSMASEYLVQLIGQNLKLSQILNHMQFRFSIGPSYFMEIAKLRAARYIWTRILEAHGLENAPQMYIQSQTSGFNQTRYDAHVNMLRGTTEAMAAILGGTDSLSVTPFDWPGGNSDEFSDRVARNCQIILKEESYLDKVVDPAAGSYYIENLTTTLVEGAWKLFLEVEEKGGYNKALIEGFIQEEIKKTADAKRSNYATRKEMLLGTNQFPILDETLGAGKEIKESVTKASSPVAGPEEDPPIIDPIVMFRGADDFEKLRLRTENSPSKTPVAFIIPLGNLAMRRARAMFTQNFFAVAGFGVVDNIGKFTTVAEGVKAAREAGAEIAVLCSSDDEYPEMAGDLVSHSGNDIIPVIAGYPKAHMEALKSAGVEHFIHLRSNLLEELTRYQDLLGI